MIGVNRTRKGFTLMETLVASSIFIILVTASIDIYIRSTRTAQQTALRAQLQANARFTMEAISRSIRVNNIDYASYAAPAGPLPAQPMSELRLMSPDWGNTVRIKTQAADANCYNDGKSFPCVAVSTDSGVSWAPLSPQNTKVDSLLFYASPANNPFYASPANGTYAADAAPLITISLALHGIGQKPSDDWVTNMQTTITPRLYRR